MKLPWDRPKKPSLDIIVAQGERLHEEMEALLRRLEAENSEPEENKPEENEERER